MLEGPAADVEALIAFCADGPGRAEVSALEVVAEEPRHERGFGTA